MNTRILTLKSILWLFAGMFAVASVARFVYGLGAATNLSDAVPWGFWNGFKMGCVALAGGGFTLAGAVYIFGLERYRPLVRSAILTAFLCYIAFAVSLTYDLGLPWHIWFPMIFHQHYSVLFEVAICVILYLHVLAFEFAPVVLEHKRFRHPFFQAIYKVLKFFTIPIVIAGIILSTLHQSSLGSLFLIVPYRVHPLWYSPLIYLQFLISAIGLGLMAVVMESLLSGFFLNRKLHKALLKNVGFAAAVTLSIYVALRLGDQLVRGVAAQWFDGTWQANLFWIEIMMGAVIPAAILFIRRARENLAGLAVAGTLCVLGIMMNRVNITITTLLLPEGVSYFPSIVEFMVTLGIISCIALAFIFCVENFKVYPEYEAKERDLKVFAHPKPQSAAWLGGVWNRGPRRYSLAAIAGAALAVGLLPRAAVFGPQPQERPVSKPYTVEIVRQGRRGEQAQRQFVLAGMEGGSGRRSKTMILGGPLPDQRLAVFPHDRHINELGEERAERDDEREGRFGEREEEERDEGRDEAVCAQCHHMNLPLQENTACYECHRDMNNPTPLFEHEYHIAQTGGNDSCALCHPAGAKVKSFATAVSCAQCHRADMVPAGAFAGSDLEAQVAPFAPSYMDAMHDLCIGCHAEIQEGRRGRGRQDFARCDGCHYVDREMLRPLMPNPRDERSVVDGSAMVQNAMADAVR